LLVGWSKVWPCQKQMLQIQNCTARVVQCLGGSVHSPTRKRKEDAMTIRCAVAASRGEALGSLQADAARSMACTGSATWGLGAGLSPGNRRKGLCHAMQGFFISLGSNLPTLPKESSRSPGGKSQEVVSRSHGSVPQSVQYCCHQRQLVARAAVSTVASSSAARAVWKLHWRAARAVGWHTAKSLL
jgi:hypothetical protein